MSTIIEAQASPPPEKEDPWRYGWRYVRRVGPDGTEYIEEVPLRQEDLLFPEESDFVVNTTAHNRDRAYLKAMLEAWGAGQEGALVAEDLRVDFGVPGLRPLGPDVVVFAGLNAEWDIERGTFPVADFGARTLLTIEVTSPDTRRNDFGVKVDFYRRAGAAFYAIVDRHETRRGLDLRLFGFRADPNAPNHYSPAPVDERGRLWLEPVRLWLAVEGGRAVLYDEEGERMLDRNEAMERVAIEKEARQEAEQARQEAEQARQEAEQARQEAEQARQEAEQARQDAEQRAAAETEARRAAEVRYRELEAELKHLRDEKKEAAP
jgi:colicin import membrane protein